MGWDGMGERTNAAPRGEGEVEGEDAEELGSGAQQNLKHIVITRVITLTLIVYPNPYYLSSYFLLFHFQQLDFEHQ